jgi:competence protein ComEC
MSFFQGWGTVTGRKIPIAEILIASGVIMLIIKPSYISDFSFILSFLATLGLCAFSEEIINFFRKFKVDRYQIINDFSSSLAAQLLVWPVISFNFGEFSIVSLLANMLTLWTIPVSTILGFILLVFLFVPGPVANILAALVYPFLDIFVSLVKILGNLPFSSIQLRISLFTLATYYIAIFIFYRILRANRTDTKLP